MLSLKLSDKESKVLTETLEKSLNHLRDEISHTDSYDYREFLKQRRDVLEKLSKKLH